MILGRFSDFPAFFHEQTPTWSHFSTILKTHTVIGDILKIAPQAAPIFMGIGMHCLGCPASQGETVEEACAVHGVDVNELLAQVNKLIGK